MEVRIATENDKEKWDKFVDEEGGSFSHYFNWKYYYEKNTLKHRFIPLIIEDEASEILGIFPIEENLRLIYGFLTSLPQGASGGFLIKDCLTDIRKKKVIQSFLDYINTYYSGSHSFFTMKEHLSLSMGPVTPTEILIENGYVWLDNSLTQLPCTHVLKLEKPFKEKIWMGLWSSKLRQQIRHARKSHVEIIIDDEFKYLDDFVDMHYQTIHKFGLVHGKEEVLGYFNFFKGKIKLFVCLLDSKPISAVLCFYTPTTAHQLLAPYNLNAKDYLTNTLPVCASIRYACEHGYTYYDMGITRAETLAEYKEKFGATRIPLREYVKTFSRFKVNTNNFYDSIKRRGNKMVGSLR